MTRSARRCRPGVVALLLALVSGLLAGCSADYSDLPLPGKEVGGETYRLSAVFAEALNLAEGAQVKVDGVPVGRVQEVVARDFKAVAVMDIEAGTELPVGSTARLRYDTPLGELFVQVDPPPGSGRGGRLLGDGEQLSDRDTSTAPTVEDTLASASLLVNGGGLAQLQTITSELNEALGGREPVVRRALARTTRFLALANDSTGDIDRALRALSSASRVLADREETIDRALREVVPISQVLRANTDDVVRLLVAVDRLSITAQRVVGRTRRDLVQVLRQVGPIMDEVLRLEPQLVPGLTSLVAAARFLDVTVEGDWVPLDANVDMDQSQVVLPGDSATLPPDGGGGGGGGLPLPTPTLPPLPGLGAGAGDGTGGLLGGLGLRAMVPRGSGGAR